MLRTRERPRETSASSRCQASVRQHDDFLAIGVGFFFELGAQRATRRRSSRRSRRRAGTVLAPRLQSRNTRRIMTVTAAS